MAAFKQNCPHCMSELEMETDWIGIEVECPGCKQPFTVNAPQQQMRRPATTFAPPPQQNPYGNPGMGYPPPQQNPYGNPGMGYPPPQQNPYGNPGMGYQPGMSVPGEKSTASLVLGLIGLIAWIIPLFGFPVTIVGLILGIKKKYTVGIVLNVITLMLTVASSAIGAYMGANGML